MNQDPIENIRENYNRVADEYARRLYTEHAGKPFDRQILERLANAVPPGGRICDMGCGPGQIARCLRDAGAEVFGLDLSPQMVGQARRLNPDIPFREGNMLALDLDDSTVAGIAAFYAVVNLPPETLPQAFREMLRVLEPDGKLHWHFISETR
jgi:ubiquinone/menaquinone biosynthesis C-methylase UbiE